MCDINLVRAAVGSLVGIPFAVKQGDFSMIMNLHDMSTTVYITIKNMLGCTALYTLHYRWPKPKLVFLSDCLFSVFAFVVVVVCLFTSLI